MPRKRTQNRSKRIRIVRAIALLFGLSVVFLYGVGVGVYHWPPFSLLKSAKHSLGSKSYKHEHLHGSKGTIYTLATSRLSFFSLDQQGNIDLRESLPREAEGTYRLERTINTNSTAIVVMDPWVDMASKQMNEYYWKILELRILPIVERALARGHPIIVLTNNPSWIRHTKSTVKYNTKIHPELQTLADNGKVSLLYHQDFDDESFAAYLRSQGIDTMIYTGFASNMCVIGRRMGMIPMTHKGFKMFFIPDASAAVEHAETWQDQSIHKATTKIISQWIAEIIDYDEFMEASVNSPR